MGRNIAVVFGGRSNENEISVITGTMALNVLKSGGDSVIPLYISCEGEIFTGENLSDINAFSKDISAFPRAQITKGGVYICNKRGKPKKFVPLYAAVNCCHGGLGEGGGVCGLFAVNGIPFASAGMFESAAFMDKYFTKLVLSALNVRVAEYKYIRGISEIDIAEKLGYPLIIKPAKLGSSIGVVRADDRAQLEAGLESAFLLDDGVIIEGYFQDKREINCAACLTEGELLISECEEALPKSGVYSFEDKYTGEGASVLPADIPKRTAGEIKNIVREVYTRLNMRGIVRFDFILSGGQIYLSEINTVPGSLAYYLFADGFKKFYPVLSAVIARAVLDNDEQDKKRIIHTGILDNIPSNACKHNRK